MAFKKVPVTYVVVNLQIEGIHNWPEAEAFAEGVSFLKHPHRHIFHIKATKKVEHDDRDIEIILMKREMQQYLYRNYEGVGEHYGMLDFDSRSCEMIAKDLCEAFDLRSCEVLEDGENGALIEIQSHFVPEVDSSTLMGKIVRERDTFDDSHLNQQ